MWHALPGIGAGIGHEAEAVGAITRAQLRGDLHHARDCRLVGLDDVLERSARNYQQMNRRLRRVVGERDADFVLVQKRNFDFAARDFRKNGFGHIYSLSRAHRFRQNCSLLQRKRDKIELRLTFCNRGEDVNFAVLTLEET